MSGGIPSSGMRSRLTIVIEQYWREHGRCPSHKEIAATMHYSVASVRNTLHYAVKDGQLIRIGLGTFMSPRDYETTMSALKVGEDA